MSVSVSCFLVARGRDHTLLYLQELEKLVEILKRTHGLLSKDLSIDSFSLMMNEMLENISLVSYSSRLASQVWNTLCTQCTLQIRSSYYFTVFGEVIIQIYVCQSDESLYSFVRYGQRCKMTSCPISFSATQLRGSYVHQRCLLLQLKSLQFHMPSLISVVGLK